jgi:hypothetical protein
MQYQGENEINRNFNTNEATFFSRILFGKKSYQIYDD